jgi:signal transduction histidine kinase
MSTAPEHPGLLPAVLLGGTLDDRGRPPKRSGRDWFVDILCLVLAVAGGVTLFALDPSRPHVALPVLWLDALAGGISSILLWWRRRWPVPVALVLTALSAFSAASGIAAVIALFTVAVHRPGRTVLLVATLSFLAGGVYALLRPTPNEPGWVSWVVSLLIVVAAAAWGMFARARRQLVLSLRERTERAEAEQELRISQARQLERTRIAREMHDVLAHRISLVSLHAGALEFRARTVGEDVARSAAVIRDSAHQALEDLREVIGILREGESGDDAPQRPLPTLDDVTTLVEESRAAGMKVSARLTLDDTSALPLSAGRTAYRIVQEGLTNARKHAPGAAVSVGLSGGPGIGLEVEVLSRRPVAPGALPSIPGSGQGLIGLVERADLAGGRLEHGWTASGDFRLQAWLPWPA